MKLKYLFSIILSSALLAVGCEQDPTDSFKNVKLSDTFLSISPDGGSVELTVTATEDWQFVNDEFWPNVVAFNKINDKTAKPEHDMFGNLINDAADINTEKTVASWLKASVMEGKAGETKVTFTAEASPSGREIEISLYAGNNIQYLRVRQGSLEAVTLTSKEIHETAVAGGTYKTGGVVTQLGNYAQYGAFWVNDGTSDKDVQIYGSTKDSKESYPDVEVGDYVEFTGVWSSYGNFEDASISEHVKSLLKVVTEPEELQKEGGELVVKVAYKGNGVFPSIPENCREWISYVGMDYKKGEPSKLVPNPSDTAIVKFNIAANTMGDREGSISFASHSGNDKSDVSYTFTQKGAIIPVSIADFLASEVAPTMYRVSGIITEIKDLSAKYNNVGVTIKDANGNSLYIYRMKPAADGGKVEELGIEVGDRITVVGQRGEYNGSPQMVSGYYESHIHYIKATVAEFLAAAVSEEVEYRVTGIIKEIEDLSAQYGNATLTISDSTGDLYVFRMKPAIDGKKIDEIGLTVGDELTVTGQRGEHNGKPQMVSCYYESHIDNQ